MLWHAFTFLARYTIRGVTVVWHVLLLGAEAFKLLKVASGVMGAQRGAICWADVQDAARVGEFTSTSSSGNLKCHQHSKTVPFPGLCPFLLKSVWMN